MYPKFTENERDHYKKALAGGRKIKHETPEQEYVYRSKTFKECSKCAENKKLTEFDFNCSGRDQFNKDGYRHHRPECKKCKKKASSGKQQAKKIAKEMGISYKAPHGIKCGICDKKKKMVFDHCHEKNIFRGYLCDCCNRSLGCFRDNIDGIEPVINYLHKCCPMEVENKLQEILLNLKKKNKIKKASKELNEESKNKRGKRTS